MAKKQEIGKSNIIQGLFLIKNEITIDVLEAQTKMLDILPKEKFTRMQEIFNELNDKISTHFPNHDNNI